MSMTSARAARLSPIVALPAACLLPLLSTVVSGQTQGLTVRPSAAVARPAESACAPKPRCTFLDRAGENTYVVQVDALSRQATGAQVYSVRLAGGSAKAMLAAMNEQRSVLAVLVGTESVATSAMFTPGTLTPDQVQRQYTLSLRNPKSGEEIKAIDLGMFKPSHITLSPAAEHVWLTGEELQLRRREVRAYNARSGAMAYQQTIDKRAVVALHASGFSMGGTTFLADLPTEDWTVRRHASANPYSIAEFTVRKGRQIVASSLLDAAIAVIGFEGAGAEVRDLLDGTLVVKLAGQGLRLVERQRIKELLQEAQFQNLGLTDSKTASELGRLVNARHLVFGELQSAGTVTTMTLRMVDVESGDIAATIDLECRDCRPADYSQAVGFLVDDWVQR